MMAKTKSLFPLFFSEFIGTALLILIGLSIVIFNWGFGSVVPRLIPSEPLRRAATGFLFGCTGCLITLSRVGKISGAHINPVVSIAFWLRGKMKAKAMAGYIVGQMLGAVAGGLPLLLWHKQGSSIHYGITVPGSADASAAFIGEMITTACLIILIFVFTGNSKLRRYTPYTMPFLYCFMVWAEAPFSGCSTNPARSFGPAVISGVYTCYWLYWLAPLAGTIVVVYFFKFTRLRRYFKIEAARVSYHNRDTHDSLKSN